MASLLVFGSVGCAKDDLYAPCDLSAGAQNHDQAACASKGAITCVVESFLNCESRACGKYNGSEPFCTQTCTTDSDCGKGKCIPFLPGVDKKYCYSEDLVKKPS